MQIGLVCLRPLVSNEQACRGNGSVFGDPQTKARDPSYIAMVTEHHGDLSYSHGNGKPRGPWEIAISITSIDDALLINSRQASKQRVFFFFILHSFFEQGYAMFSVQFQRGLLVFISLIILPSRKGTVMFIAFPTNSVKPPCGGGVAKR